MRAFIQHSDLHSYSSVFVYRLFHTLALSIKLTHHLTNKPYNYSISELYEECKSRNITRSEWDKFIKETLVQRSNNNAFSFSNTIPTPPSSNNTSTTVPSLTTTHSHITTKTKSSPKAKRHTNGKTNGR
jgi:hypothetical protein